jgi:hypothetical protein
MKYLFLSLITAGMLLSACNNPNQASDAATAGNATVANTANLPVMKFENISHDFGKVTQGAKVTYDFKFTNTGKSPLIITNARASCGCTVPAWPHTPIKLGDDASIHVVFDSGTKKGLIDKQITITANTNPAENRVHLIGEVLLPKK